MRRLMGFGLMGMLALCGCLQQARTPYNEVAIFGGEGDEEEELIAPPEVANLWPLYISDGRASYFLWPLIKSSPGCFAVQPLFNYDHGIQDYLWLLTLSPKSGEYRLWPLFYRSPERWFAFPLAYATDTPEHESAGSPFLFNWKREWLTTTARTGAEARVAPIEEEHNLPLLWARTRYFAPSGPLPVDALENAFPTREGTEWGVLLGALYGKDLLTRQAPDAWTRERDSQFGWLLWRQSETFRHRRDGDRRTSHTFTPLFSVKTDDLASGSRDVQYGLLLNTISLSLHDGAYRGFDLLWRFLYEDRVSTPTCRTTKAFCGLLFSHDRNAFDFTVPDCRTPNVMERRRQDNAETTLLCGLLYSHKREDTQKWRWDGAFRQPEQPLEETFRDDTYVLTPLVYIAERQRDGSFGRRLILGLLFDQTHKTANDTETFGILGYLYRFNHYADGTRSRTLFPFLNLTTHDDSPDWTFSFLHKLFRIERTAEGTRWWLFWL